jgi:uncharacterized C2H2 Zn-finger protein
METAKTEFIMQGLNEMNDFDSSFQFQDLSIPMTFSTPLERELFTLNESGLINATSLGYAKEAIYPYVYPTFPSPPQTAALDVVSGNQIQQMSFDWNIQQNVELVQGVNQKNQRKMSMPHMGQFSYFDQFQSRKNSISSAGTEKIYPCTHPGCDRTFSRIQNMRSHMRCHLATAPHECKQCGLGFRRTTDLQRHIRTMHIPNDQKPWACPKCPKRFGRSDALKRHMASKSKDHGCPGGPDYALIRQLEEQKRMKTQKKETFNDLQRF